MEFSEKLEKVMKDHHLTGRAVSKATGLSESTISQYRSGKIRPSEKAIRKVAAALRVPAKDLLPDSPQKDHPEKITLTVISKGLHRSKWTVARAIEDGAFGDKAVAVRMPGGVRNRYIFDDRYWIERLGLAE